MRRGCACDWAAVRCPLYDPTTLMNRLHGDTWYTVPPHPYRHPSATCSKGRSRVIAAISSTVARSTARIARLCKAIVGFLRCVWHRPERVFSQLRRQRWEDHDDFLRMGFTHPPKKRRGIAS